MPRKLQIIFASSVVVLYAAIEVQNSIGGKSYVAHYFKGTYQGKKLFQKEKIHCSRGQLSRGVRYAEIGYEGFYCSNSSIRCITHQEVTVYGLKDKTDT